MSKNKNSFKDEDYYRPLRVPRIFTIHGMSDLKIGADNRTYGWVESLAIAQAIVLKDGEMLHEECYNYIVIEMYGPGVYRTPNEEYWYRWNFRKQRYMPIDKPSSMKGIVSFGM